MLSRRAKEAIKTGLAMSIAYGIALGMDWEKPHWAGFAVAMISLSSIGHSLNKGAMRMVGTLIAIVAALTLLALFPQDRWLLMLALTIYLAICCYKLTGDSRTYAWFVSAFVCLVVVVSAGTSSEEAFGVAVERAQETGMGILVYALVAAFVWPKSSRADLEDATLKLVGVQHHLFQAYRGLMKGEGTADASQALRTQEVKLAGVVGNELQAAETDSYSVWEVRHSWRRLRGDLLLLGEMLERWRESFPEVSELDLRSLFPDLTAYLEELEKRFSTIEAILAGKPSQPAPETASLTVNPAVLKGLNHFQQAAAMQTKSQLARIEALTRGIIQGARDIKGSERPRDVARAASGRERRFTLDPDRLTATFRVLVTLWVGFFVWIYIDPPGHATFAQSATIFAMVVAMMPQLRPTMMVVPFALGAVFAGLLHILVMPKLSGYWELGLLIFGVTAAIYYLFWLPQQALAKMGAIVTFIILISVENQQSYDFASYANKATMLMLSIALVIVLAYIPVSPRPEKVFLRLFARFFREVDFLLSRIAIDWEQKAGLAARVRASLSSNDLLALSQKLALHAKQIDHRSFPDNPPEKVEALATSLSAIAFRMKELLETRDQPQAEILVREMLEELRAWRLAIQQQIHLWAEDPEAAAQESSNLHYRLKERLSRLEAHVEEAFGRMDDGALQAADYENFYRLLGNFRGLSDAGLVFIDVARDINWKQWREARF